MYLEDNCNSVKNFPSTAFLSYITKEALMNFYLLTMLYQ